MRYGSLYHVVAETSALGGKNLLHLYAKKIQLGWMWGPWSVHVACQLAALFPVFRFSTIINFFRNLWSGIMKETRSLKLMPRYCIGMIQQHRSFLLFSSCEYECITILLLHFIRCGNICTLCLYSYIFCFLKLFILFIPKTFLFPAALAKSFFLLVMNDFSILCINLQAWLRARTSRNVL